jgi:acetyl-CoA acetyltransferase
VQDLTARLRYTYECLLPTVYAAHCHTVLEAAEEIERLRAENARLRMALSCITNEGVCDSCTAALRAAALRIGFVQEEDAR